MTTKPFVVKNHETKQREILIQDQKNQVILLSNKGKVLWDVDVKNPIIGEVHQVDIYKNGKLQYLFATKDKIYCLDRRGRAVTNFPFSVNNDEIEFMTLIDYDGSKKYRILASTNQNELRMYDIKGKNLKGWDPQPIKGSLVVAPLHMRVKGRDVIFALQKDGKAHLWNRRGKAINKFPKDLEEEIHAPIFMAKGKKINESTFSFTTASGKIQKYNFKGDQLFTKEMAKNGESLHMVLSPDHKEYALVKETENHLYFYNNYLKEQFFIPTIENYQVSKAQYYPIKKGKSLYVNYSDQKAYFHLEENKTFIEQEIVTPQKMSLLYYKSSNKYLVYKVEGTKVIAEEVKDLKKLH